MDFQDKIALEFLQYLKEQGHQKTMRVDRLRAIYEVEYEAETYGTTFSSVLDSLSFCLNKLQINQGKVTFGCGDAAASQIFDSDDDSDSDEPVLTAVNHCPVCKRDFRSYSGLQQHFSTVRHRQQSIVCSIKKSLDRASLKENKKGIKVTSVPSSDENGVIELHLTSDTSGEITLMVENTADEFTQLKHITLLWSNKFFDYRDIARIDTYRGALNPGLGAQFRVGCRKRNEFGSTHVPAVLGFEQNGNEFLILRFLSVMVVSDIFDALKATSAFRGVAKPDRIPFDVRTIPGVSLPKLASNKLVMERLPDYKIPIALQSQVRGKSVSQDVSSKLTNELTFENYKEKFSTLLHIEEIQMQKDIRTYDMKGVKFHREGLFLVLEVPGLAENRPSVLRGDRILAYEQGVRSVRYEGVVHKVEQLQVKLRFDGSFNYIDGMKYDIQFTFNRLPVKLGHRACDKLSSRGDMEGVLFPDPDTICQREKLVAPYRLNFFDRNLNEEQKRAVQQILAGTSRPAPYLIFGPPGTGKTVTVVEAIKQVYSTFEHSVILACAPENTAADLIAERLLAHIDKGKMFRMYASSRPWNFVSQKLKEARVVNFDSGSRETFYPSASDLQKDYRIIITTLVTAGRLASANFPRDHFTHVFIDEAGHAVEPEAVIPVADLLNPNNPRGGQLVVAGDPKQLGPILRSSITKEHGLEISLLERLMSVEGVYTRGMLGYNGDVLTKLVNNYRSHRAIIEIPKQLFYDNELNECAGDFRNVMLGWEELPNGGFPIIFHPVFGKDEREAESPSFFNVSEVETIQKYLAKLLNENERSKGLKHLQPEMVGIISPYKRQVQKIQTMIKEKRYSSDIKVGSVEEFQGQERRVIIVSTVRSTNREFLDMDNKYKLGFLKNPKRFNVAITRAQALLILIGNPNMLYMDDNWAKFLDHCEVNGGWVNVTDRGSAEGVRALLRKLDMCVDDGGTDEDVDFSHVHMQEHPEWTRHE